MRIRTALVLAVTLTSTTARGAQDPPPLVADEVISKLMDHNSQREKLGAGYSGSRHYVLENQKWNKRAEMLVGVRCDADGIKHFAVVSEEGWKSANKRVLRKMLESETETSRPEIRPTTSITPENYRFQMLGTESVDGRTAYVIQVLPKRQDKYLFEGRIWVDAVDFAMVRAEGRPAKNPSFWTRSVHFVQRYHKSGTFWFPTSTESVTDARIFGKTDVSISYFDYRPNCAAPSVPEGADVASIEANHVED